MQVVILLQTFSSFFKENVVAIALKKCILPCLAEKFEENSFFPHGHTYWKEALFRATFSRGVLLAFLTSQNNY